MNIFQCSFNQRLREWHNLRKIIINDPLDQKCVKVDKWWQMAPLVNHHLHPRDQLNWPDPWTLLSENTYCLLTRALGIIYTLKMIEVDNIKLFQADNKQGDEYPIVVVDSAKYILNYWPDMVLNICLKEFTIKREIPIDFSKIKN